MFEVKFSIKRYYYYEKLNFKLIIIIIKLIIKLILNYQLGNFTLYHYNHLISLVYNNYKHIILLIILILILNCSN